MSASFLTAVAERAGRPQEDALAAALAEIQLMHQQAAADQEDEEASYLDEVLERAVELGLLTESDYDRLTDALASGARSEDEVLAEWAPRLQQWEENTIGVVLDLHFLQLYASSFSLQTDWSLPDFEEALVRACGGGTIVTRIACDSCLDDHLEQNHGKARAPCLVPGAPSRHGHAPRRARPAGGAARAAEAGGLRDEAFARKGRERWKERAPAGRGCWLQTRGARPAHARPSADSEAWRRAVASAARLARGRARQPPRCTANTSRCDRRRRGRLRLRGRWSVRRRATREHAGADRVGRRLQAGAPRSFARLALVLLPPRCPRRATPSQLGRRSSRVPSWPRRLPLAPQALAAVLAARGGAGGTLRARIVADRTYMNARYLDWIGGSQDMAPQPVESALSPV